MILTLLQGCLDVVVSFVESVWGLGFFQAGKNKAAARLPEQEEDVLEKKPLWTKCVDQKCWVQWELLLMVPANIG